MYELKDAKYITKLPQGKHSTKGMFTLFLSLSLSTSPSSLSLTLSTYISLISFPYSLNTCLIGMGATTPGSIVTLDNGCEVPMGPGVEDSTSRTSLLYNEYIVYDTSQINIKYLFQLKFNYKTSSRRRR